MDQYQEVFQKYIEVCNEAIERHKDHFPYRELWSAGAFLCHHDFDCAIYDNRPKGVYRLHVNEEKQLEMVNEAKPNVKRAWKMPYTYLEKVVEHPEEYIENPAKLDWEWLRSRVSG